MSASSDSSKVTRHDEGRWPAASRHSDAGWLGDRVQGRSNFAHQCNAVSSRQGLITLQNGDVTAVEWVFARSATTSRARSYGTVSSRAGRRRHRMESGAMSLDGAGYEPDDPRTAVSPNDLPRSDARREFERIMHSRQVGIGLLRRPVRRRSACTAAAEQLWPAASRVPPGFPRLPGRRAPGSSRRRRRGRVVSSRASGREGALTPRSRRRRRARAQQRGGG